MSDMLLGKSFTNADADDNGKIDFNEFVNYYNHMHDVLPTAMAEGDWAEALAVFRCFDQDKNGRLDSNEMRMLLNQVFPDHCKRNNEFVSDQMKEADMDGDGTVTVACCLRTQQHPPHTHPTPTPQPP